jgi:hypothetical protein
MTAHPSPTGMVYLEITPLGEAGLIVDVAV